MRGRAAAAAGVLLCLVAGVARAEGSAPPGLRGLLHVFSADPAGRGVLETGVFSSFHTRTDTEDRRYFFSVTHFLVEYGFSDHMEIGVGLPVRFWRVGSSGASPIEPSRLVGFGDVETGAKLLLPLPWRTIRIGALGRLSLATGSGLRGFTSASTDLALGGVVTLDLTEVEHFVPTRVHFNFSHRWNRNEADGVGLAPLENLRQGGFWPPAYPGTPPGENSKYNDQLLWGGAVEFSTRILTLFTEFTVDYHPKISATSWRDHPVLLTQGALIKFRNGLNLKTAVDVSLQKDSPPADLPKLPEWRLTFGLTWRTKLTLGDKDQDGIPDKRDSCVTEAEDFDGFEDEDGCPDLDNDQDGVPDREDLAPDLPEDFDGFEDEDGRPDYDNDGDGIRDDEDECPDEPEDFDGDRDSDGCPDRSPPR